MKLKNDICSNAITGEIVDIAANDLNLQNIRNDAVALVKKAIESNSTNADVNTTCTNVDEIDASANCAYQTMNNDISMDSKSMEDDKEESHLLSYVNQFRLRTCNNISASLEFFFNDGSLSGNEVMHQVFHVKAILNNVGICALMVQMDAGGNNTHLGTLLRHEAKLGNKGWLGKDERLISFKDPAADHCQREMHTAVVLCSTHNQKSSRNAFCNSSSKNESVRYFESCQGCKCT